MRRARGLLLLELVIALAIFVTIGTLIMATVRQALLSTEAARDLIRAEDFAASVLAMIVTDLETPEALNGPLPEWSDEEGYFGAGLEGASAEGFGAREEEWVIEIDTAAAGVAGFTSITVTVSREDRLGVSATREALVEFGDAEGLAMLGEGSVYPRRVGRAP